MCNEKLMCTLHIIVSQNYTFLLPTFTTIKNAGTPTYESDSCHGENQSASVSPFEDQFFRNLSIVSVFPDGVRDVLVVFVDQVLNSRQNLVMTTMSLGHVSKNLLLICAGSSLLSDALGPLLLKCFTVLQYFTIYSNTPLYYRYRSSLQ